MKTFVVGTHLKCLGKALQMSTQNIYFYEERKLSHNDHNLYSFLTLVLLNRIYPAFANSVDPDQLASEEANWSGSALFAIKYVNLYQ